VQDGEELSTVQQAPDDIDTTTSDGIDTSSPVPLYADIEKKPVPAPRKTLYTNVTPKNEYQDSVPVIYSDLQGND